MNEIKIVRNLSKLLGVSEGDIPKTLRRFRDDVEEMEKELRITYSKAKYRS